MVAAPLAAQPDTGIQKVDATHYVVERAVVVKLAQAGEPKEARAVPETQDGRPVGLRLFGIRRDGVLGQLGLENGDRAVSVNGLPLAPMEKALATAHQLRDADHVTLLVHRRGQDMRLEYDVK